MMSCEEFAEHASDYLDGRVPFGRRIGMWFHALICEGCGEYLDQLEKVLDLMHEAGERESEEGPSEEVKDDLMEEFRKRRGS